MHRGVVSCAAYSSGTAVVRIMAAHRIHSVVVRGEDGAPRLVADAAVAAAMFRESLDTSTALELSQPAVVVRPEDTIAEALRRFQAHGTTHAVVVDSASHAIGIVSVIDLAEWWLEVHDIGSTRTAQP